MHIAVVMAYYLGYLILHDSQTIPKQLPSGKHRDQPKQCNLYRQITQNQYIFEASTLISPLRVPTFCLKTAPHLWPSVGLDLEAIAPHLHH